MSTTKKSRKKKATRVKEWKSSDALIRKALADSRRKLAQEFAADSQRRYHESREVMEWMKIRNANADNARKSNFVPQALRPRLSAVIASWNVKAPLVLTPDHQSSASTDFKNIFVKYNSRLALEDADRRTLAAEIRGMTYHELGHILFSTPFPILFDQAVDQGWIWYKDTAQDMREVKAVIVSTLQGAWNALEDQRMEMQMVVESPRMAAYFTVMVMQLILPTNDQDRFVQNYPLVVGRTYLPLQLRQMARTAFTNYRPEVDLRALQIAVRKYLLATNAKDMMEAVVAYAEILRDEDGEVGEVGKTGNGKAKPGAAPKDNYDSMAEPDRESERGKHEQKQASNKITDDKVEDLDDEGFDGEAGEQGTGDIGKPESPEQGGRKAGTDDGPENNEPVDQSTLDELWADALNERDGDYNLDEDVKDLNNSFNNVPEDGLQLEQKGTALTDAETKEADQLADDIEQAFRIANADMAPTWQSQQREGILEPIRYRTRQAGDMEFWRNFADRGEDSRDIEVSVFLDTSGSMDAFEVALGQCAYGVKAGLHRLGIPCEVILFNTKAVRLYGKDDAPIEPLRLKARGGTNPSDAFQAVLTEPRATKTHLVLVMTDGDWEGDKTSMRLYNEANRYSVFFQFQPGTRDNQFTDSDMDYRQSLLMGLNSHHPDEAYLIGSLAMIPHTLESILAQLAGA